MAWRGRVQSAKKGMKFRPKDERIRGFTQKDLLVVIVFLALLGFLVVPALVRARQKRARLDCTSNLMQIGTAMRVWEGDHNDLYPPRFFTNQDGSMKYAVPSQTFRYFQVLSNELRHPRALICPFDDRKPAATFATLSNNNISYFLGMDADETFPGMLLGGDRNITINGKPASPGPISIKPADSLGWSKEMHGGAGNVALSDGSVQQVTSTGLKQLSARNANPTNGTRLVIP